MRIGRRLLTVSHVGEGTLDLMLTGSSVVCCVVPVNGSHDHILYTQTQICMQTYSVHVQFSGKK